MTITAEAHCDIPCGIYDPTPAKIAAKTVARMVEQIRELQAPDSNEKHILDHYYHAISRRVAVKERFSDICKNELETLWSDYFKPEHLRKFPDLHTTIWKAVKLCSKNKQEIFPQATEELLHAVDSIAEMFYSVKGTPERYEAYKIITDSL